MAIVEGWKVMLPMVQNLLMEIYCIILSSQHKCLSMSMSVSQVQLRKTAPPSPSRQNSSGSSLLQICTQWSSRTLGSTRMLFHWVPSRVCLSLFVLMCVHVCIPFVCTFPLVTGWLAAVLESLLTESVGSVEYFYPLACVREQVEALWGYNKVTW